MRILVYLQSYKLLMYKIFCLVIILLLHRHINAQCKIQERIINDQTNYISNAVNLSINLKNNTNTILNVSFSLVTNKFTILFYSTHINTIELIKDQEIRIILNDHSTIVLHNLKDSKTNPFNRNSRINWSLYSEALVYKYQLFKIQDLGIKSIILADTQWNISKKSNKELNETIACLLDLSKNKNYLKI